ncbi:DMT family transporter [Tepidibacter hydrothermalis]|uniref:DMT family transporter n=1 Tax=Tepidibacter hydrothermalis TaxID=3036126 RepID=A0ABY8ECB7_9FIRM|nr:DMT family transporter [Tepidibacter hydrothermalis]WFD10539.1 DMT family transporter [Tepidibacter hydrothermalis]
MLGVIFSFIGGIFITIQGVFNTRVSDKIGLWETTVIVHAVGLTVALIVMFIWGEGSFKKLQSVNKLYLIGGAFGVIIIFSVIKGFTLLGPSYSIAILLITQLITGTIIDTFGLFGNPQMKFHLTKPLGILVMIAGIIIFKLK